MGETVFGDRHGLTERHERWLLIESQFLSRLVPVAGYRTLRLLFQLRRKVTTMQLLRTELCMKWITEWLFKLECMSSVQGETYWSVLLHQDVYV